jgi:CMP-N,N'-diacetyllegionaminic acid synthase
MEILALIPARGGSKSIPRKNLLKVGGKPLVAHSIQVALGSKRITRTIVSTDDPEIGDVAESFGAEVPFQRPADISGDYATDLDVFRHALLWLDANESYRPELIVQLRPTQPVRRAPVVDRAIDLMLAHPEADSLRSVELTDQIPYKMWRIQAGKMVPVVELPGVFEAHSAPRQILPNIYQHNGYVDVIRRRTILEMGSICGMHVIPFMMDEHVVDLDYQEQIAELEAAFDALRDPGESATAR